MSTLRKNFLSCLLAFSAVTCSASTLATTADSGSMSIATDTGRVVGVKQDGYRAFKGIPYAQPPVGALRWMPPVQAEPWQSPLAADKFRDICATKFTLGGFGSTSDSEDCLYLNVYAPSHPASGASKWPVMVWIHGGGLGTGSGDDYDVSRLVDKGVIVVTFNYRLGMFGFFSHPAINGEGHPAINYGTLDQQAALKWVNKNIAQFGGDNKNVTIFGESAGGHSVLAQIVSPGAKGLFQKAIVSSGSYSLKQPTIDEATELGQQFAENTGCGKLEGSKAAACLRGLSTNDILEKGFEKGVKAQVVTDGQILPMPFIDAFRDGRFNRASIINGFNSNEGTFFAGLVMLQSGHPIDRAAYLESMKSFLGARQGEALFSIANLPADGRDLGAHFADFYGRAKFICPTPMVNSLLAKYVPVYAYEFADTTAPSLLDPVSFPYKAAHASELQYIFKGFHGATGRTTSLNTTQQRLSGHIVGFWTNFAKSGNPNGAGLPTWQPYTPDNESTIEFATQKSSMITHVSAKYECAELNEILKR